MPSPCSRKPDRPMSTTEYFGRVCQEICYRKRVMEIFLFMVKFMQGEPKYRKRRVKILAYISVVFLGSHVKKSQVCYTKN